jgi:V/A-type H+-transporting ATPase subunit C
VSAAARYAYLHTRVSLLAGRLLPGDTLNQLMDQTLEEQRQTLKPFDLQVPMAERSLDEKALEQALITRLVDEAQGLARPLTGSAREMIAYWVRRFEMANLKAIMRAMVSGRPAADIRGDLLDLGPLAALPVDSLIHAEDTAELLRRLEQSVYADMARQARGIYEEQRELFAVEAALDKEYFTGLSKRANALPDEEGRDLRRLTKVFIDQMNLVWLLRYRHVYGMEPAHAYYLLVPAGQYLNSEALLSLVQLGGIEEVVRQLPTPLGRLMTGVTSIPEVEAAMRRETARVARRVLDYTTFNLARPCAYLLLREWQLWQVQGALKGAQLRLDPAVLRSAARIEADAKARKRGGAEAA